MLSTQTPRRLLILRKSLLREFHLPATRPTASRPFITLGKVVGAVGIVGAGTILAGLNPIHAESVAGPVDGLVTYIKPKSPILAIEESKNDLTQFTWGANGSKTTANDGTKDTRQPSPFIAISGSGVALRDLAFHEKHAACVDASGNVYQWGDGFFCGMTEETPRVPFATLVGKDIVKISLSGPKLYALSRSGRVYVISTSLRNQTIPSSTSSSSAWWNISWLWSQSPTVDFIELTTDSKLTRGERITSISTGRSHLLALTSSGRTFASPITSSANSNGQLGIRKLSLPLNSSLTDRVSIDLVPRAQTDPFALSTPAIRRTSTETITNTPSDTNNENNIRYCDALFEVPSLKGVKVLQAVAGDRTSYALTENHGRVLGWGANEYGQIGLGNTFAIEHVPIPTEVALSRSYPSATSIKCTNVSAGGNVAYFTVEATPSSSPQPSIDLLSCGMGQFGSLGNNLYTQSQGTPVKVKSISGIQEYNETTKSIQPLAPKTVSASPTNHVIVTLDTFGADHSAKNSVGPASKGRDIMVWGANNGSQLGIGKRSNIPQPTYLPSEPFVGTFDVDTKVGRMMGRERKIDVLKDFTGRTVKKSVMVEQTVVAGWGCSAVYWKVSP